MTFPASRRLVFRFPFAAIVVFALAVVAPMSAIADDTLRLGGVFSLTGKLTSLGQSGAVAAKLAVKEINDRGGITVGGKPYRVELILRDDRGVPAEAVASISFLQEPASSSSEPCETECASPLSALCSLLSATSGA